MESFYSLRMHSAGKMAADGGCTLTCAELSTVMVMVMVTNRIDLESILD